MALFIPLKACMPCDASLASSSVMSYKFSLNQIVANELCKKKNATGKLRSDQKHAKYSNNVMSKEQYECLWLVSNKS